MNTNNNNHTNPLYQPASLLHLATNKVENNSDLRQVVDNFDFAPEDKALIKQKITENNTRLIKEIKLKNIKKANNLDDIQSFIEFRTPELHLSEEIKVVRHDFTRTLNVIELPNRFMYSTSYEYKNKSIVNIASSLSRIVSNIKDRLDPQVLSNLKQLTDSSKKLEKEEKKHLAKEYKEDRKRINHARRRNGFLSSVFTPLR